jgi:hypothetical protein
MLAEDQDAIANSLSSGALWQLFFLVKICRFLYTRMSLSSLCFVYLVTTKLFFRKIKMLQYLYI